MPRSDALAREARATSAPLGKTPRNASNQRRAALYPRTSKSNQDGIERQREIADALARAAGASSASS